MGLFLNLQKPRLRPRGFFLESGTAYLMQGDSRELLRNIPDNTFNCVVTSPPYWGQRDYGTAVWIGGDPKCDHIRVNNMQTSHTSSGMRVRGTSERERLKNIKFYTAECKKCGAIRQDRQIGIEEHPQTYINEMVELMREVRRTLKQDGTCWLNIGDKYQDKQLLMLPARLALKLQKDGWILRSDIIWTRGNSVMPESIRDRPTVAHEHIFLLTKTREYYYDWEAIAEPATNAGMAHYAPRPTRATAMGRKASGNEAPGAPPVMQAEVRNIRNVWTISNPGSIDEHYAQFPPALVERCVLAGCPKDGMVLDPFGGAGTTALAACLMARHCTLIELSQTSVDISRKRLQQKNIKIIEVTQESTKQKRRHVEV